MKHTVRFCKHHRPRPKAYNRYPDIRPGKCPRSRSDYASGDVRQPFVDFKRQHALMASHLPLSRMEG